MSPCPRHRHGTGYRLDLFADRSHAVVYASRSRSLAHEKQKEQIVQSLIDASQRNAMPGQTASYHLRGQMVLIVNSPVAGRIRDCVRDTLVPVRYREMKVVGIDLSSQRYPNPEQVIEACRNCASLNGKLVQDTEDTEDAE